MRRGKETCLPHRFDHSEMGERLRDSKMVNPPIEVASAMQFHLTTEMEFYYVALFLEIEAWPGGQRKFPNIN